MRLGLVGVGRLGSVLLACLRRRFAMRIYDQAGRKAEDCEGVANVGGIAELTDCDGIILAVPDCEILACVEQVNRLSKPVVMINVATNVTRTMLRAAVTKRHQGVGAKFIGQADEMKQGKRPVIIIDHEVPQLDSMLREIFAPVGQVIAGDSDIVAAINRIAAEEALAAAVRIESLLAVLDIRSRAMLASAIEQVAAGTLKAYAADNLGPFAQDIIKSVRKKIKCPGNAG